MTCSCHCHTKRSSQQNKLLHALFKELSEEMTAKGISISKIYKDGVEIPATPENVKNLLWRPIQEKMYQIHSTTQLDRSKMINEIYDTLNQTLIERTGGEISMPPFPEEE